ncbi:TetR family transcriptional regulator [Actinocorallia herbida]|uniref:TetR family transcriptional regulator n=1 Tax=Actinocorallia herbida TaxID=58109 RepID=A0A3N1D3A8_9ACTN|nr:TetR/AcrR family transcriptional regulator [Actinocorallia herbida]ROO87538.1 TetR family transcriptional regulator [Actinocorallia herbida]
MRADAQRNAQKLRAAAIELFRERGLQVPLKEIARHAGVSHGTLYNLFGGREALINEVVADLAVDRLDGVAERALACSDAWDGFAYYVEGVCELQATDPAISDVVTGRYPDAERLMDVCGRIQVAATHLIARAQQAGALRPDYTGEDLLFIFGTNALLARAAAGTAPDAWRRAVALMLDGLRAQAARPLPAGPLTSQQAYTVMGRLTAAP